MPSNALLRAGKSLLIPAFLATLAGCDNAAEPVAVETPAAEAVVADPAPAASAASADPVPAGTAAPVAAASSEAAPARAPAPAVGKAATPPVAARPAPAPAPTPTADPHAGHDMSTMSEEDMKKMGHDR